MSGPKTKIGHVAEVILAQVVNGTLRPGERLESERSLTRQFGVSLGTVQRALDQLQTRGIIVREHGRGTFVKSDAATPDVRFVRFATSDGKIMPLYITLLSIRRAARNGPWADFFGEAASFERIERIINVGGKFDLFSEFVMTSRALRQLKEAGAGNFEKNLRQAIAETLSLPTVRVEQRIRFEPLPARATRMLGTDDKSKAFVMELYGYTVDDSPLYFQRLFGHTSEGISLIVER